MKSKIAGVVSGSRRINQSKFPRTGIVIGWFLHFCLRLRKTSFHWIISVGVISEIGRKWNRSDSSDSDSVELMTPLTSPIFDFHLVGSPLTTPTPSPVKTHLSNALFSNVQAIEMKRLRHSDAMRTIRTIAGIANF